VFIFLVSVWRLHLNTLYLRSPLRLFDSEAFSAFYSTEAPLVVCGDGTWFFRELRCPDIISSMLMLA
jgi:hypothetical protein